MLVLGSRLWSTLISKACGSAPAAMPKIKGTSGRRRERLKQSRELKSAGGGNSWEGAVFRCDHPAGPSRGHGHRSGPRTVRPVEAALVDRRRDLGPHLPSFPAEGVDLKHWVTSSPSVSFDDGSRWRRKVPPATLVSPLGRSNVCFSLGS